LTPRGTQRGLQVTRRGADGAQRTIDVKADDLVQVDDVIIIRESWF
jgi:polysaccharide export outer membrane protein